MGSRNINISSIAYVAVSMLVGLLVLAGFFFGDVGGIDLRFFVSLFSGWAATIIAFALLLGLANVLRVHLGRVVGQGEGWPYSATLVGSALAVIVVGLLTGGSAGSPPVQWLFQYLYQPVAASLSALLVFFVISAAFRTLNAGPSSAWVMLGVALVIILGSAAWSRVAPLNVLADTRDWLLSYPVMAGMRGILLGAALGAAATSLRVLLGIDRPST